MLCNECSQTPLLAKSFLRPEPLPPLNNSTPLRPPNSGWQNTVASQSRVRHPRNPQWQKKLPKMRSPRNKSLVPHLQPRQPRPPATPVPPLPSPPFFFLKLTSTQSPPSCPTNEQPLPPLLPPPRDLSPPTRKTSSGTAMA